MNKIKIIALYGESGSGKDYWAKQLLAQFHNKTHAIVSCTTRPPRDYEKEGVDYFFLTPDQFGEKVLNGDMLEATSFNDWFYGTSLSALDPEKINVGVFNPEGMECIIEDPRLDVTPVYIYASAKTRLLRALNREDNPNCHEICRRFFTDEKDFDEMEEFESYSYYNDIYKAHKPLTEEDFIKELFDDKGNIGQSC